METIKHEQTQTQDKHVFTGIVSIRDDSNRSDVHLDLPFRKTEKVKCNIPVLAGIELLFFFPSNCYGAVF